MEVAASNAVSTARYMNQAQTAEQAQMQLFKQALDMQSEQITEVLASADTGAQPSKPSLPRPCLYFFIM